MNNKRRAEIRKIHMVLETILADIERVKGEEELAYDNMPENLQYSDRGEASQEAIDCLEEVYNNMEEIIDLLEEVV
jgi:hypothetical protein